MMNRLAARAEAIAAKAKRERLEQLANRIRAAGLRADIEQGRVVFRGRALLRRMLGEPLLRFASWSGW